MENVISGGKCYNIQFEIKGNICNGIKVKRSDKCRSVNLITTNIGQQTLEQIAHSVEKGYPARLFSQPSTHEVYHIFFSNLAQNFVQHLAIC